MSRLIVVSVLLVFLLAAPACAPRYTIGAGDDVTAEGVLTVGAEWVKDEGDSFDLRVLMVNRSAAPIIVLMQDMRCARGDTWGRLQHTFFNTGERTIDFRPHERKSFNMVCSTGDATGHFSLVVDRVYDDPEGRGVRPGNVIAQDIAWTWEAPR